MMTNVLIEVLVSTDWVAEHARAASLRVVEVDVDTEAYEEGHIPGAWAWNWTRDLCDTVVRDIVSKPKLEALLGRSGIDPHTTIVLYGDNHNWFAAWAFWQLKIYGHEDVRIMDGGRKKWLAEKRPLASDMPIIPATRYHARSADLSLRAFLPEALQAMRTRSAVLIDVRSPKEFSGEILSPPGLGETCQRGGHIPGARNIPWAQACNDDGTFKSRDELVALFAAHGVVGSKPVITYCRIGERSSHTWFVLKYLVGYPDVKNYDGSWTEWGNLVGVPIER